MSLRPLAIVALAAVIACDRVPSEPAAHLLERTHMTMGSELRVSVWTANDAPAGAAFDAVFDEFDRLEDLMSVWREGSDIQRLNAAAGEHPVPVSPEVREVLRIAHQVSDWTGGKFDVTFGALSGLWKFDYQDKDNTIPDRGEVLKRLPLINYRDLEVDERAGTAFLKRKGMRVNLGGIGKGYAVDRAVDILRRRGLRDFMIQAGGDLYVAGRRGDRPWRLGHPRSAGAGRPELRDARSLGRHVQHVRRLRALLHEGRAPLPSHPRSDGRRARATDAAASRS